MKHLKLLSFVLFQLIAFAGAAQTFTASYKATRVIKVENNGQILLQDSLPLTGHLYVKEHRAITFLNPLYLQDYPAGEIEVNNKNSELQSYAILMDSLQSLTYIDTDSLIFRNCMEIAGGVEGPLYQYTLRPTGYDKNWTIHPGIRTIEGYECERGTMHDKQGNITTDVWFTRQIPTPINLFGKLGLPGLAIEGTVYQEMETTRFRLTKYTPAATFSDSIFSPERFNGEFIMIN